MTKKEWQQENARLRKELINKRHQWSTAINIRDLIDDGDVDGARKLIVDLKDWLSDEMGGLAEELDGRKLVGYKI